MASENEALLLRISQVAGKPSRDERRARMLTPLLPGQINRHRSQQEPAEVSAVANGSRYQPYTQPKYPHYRTSS